MQTITTRYRISRHGAVIQATASGVGNNASARVPYDAGVNEESLHAEAARKLAERLEWEGDFVGGQTAKGMVWLFVKSPDGFTSSPARARARAVSA